MKPRFPLDDQLARRIYAWLDRHFFEPTSGTWSPPYGTCTYANALPIDWLEAQGYTCKMFGKSEDDFRGQPWETEYGCPTGHDWLVVDDRWIVDLWAAEYLSVPNAVYDLASTEGAALALHVLGPQEEWREAARPHVLARICTPGLMSAILADIITCPQGELLPAPRDALKTSSLRQHY